MTTKKKTTTKNSDLTTAKRLMNQYAGTHNRLVELLREINTEAEELRTKKDEIGEKLLAIGNKKSNRKLFDEKGNLHLGKGYLHIATNTIVQTNDKFDAMEFQKAFPDLIDLTKALKLAPIKKAFLNDVERPELISLGVSTTTKENLEVLLSEEE